VGAIKGSFGVVVVVGLLSVCCLAVILQLVIIVIVVSINALLDAKDLQIALESASMSNTGDGTTKKWLQ